MIVFDASVLISHLSVGDPLHHEATGMLEELEEFDFAASSLTVAECLVHASGADVVTSVLGTFHRLRLIQFDLTSADTVGIAEVRHSTGLRMPDSVVLFTAESRGADLATADRRLARAAESRGLTVHLLAPGSLAA